MANNIRRKYAPLNTTIQKLDIEPHTSSLVVISEEELTGDLPAEYGETRVVIQVQDPHWAWVYWEYPILERKKLEAELGSFEFAHTELFLRVINETMGYTFDVKLPKNCDNWYLSLNDSDCDYWVQLCAHSPSVGFIALASSGTIHTPTDTVSRHSAKWVNPKLSPVKAKSRTEKIDGGNFVEEAEERLTEKESLFTDFSEIIASEASGSVPIGGSSEALSAAGRLVIPSIGGSSETLSTIGSSDELLKNNKKNLK